MVKIVEFAKKMKRMIEPRGGHNLERSRFMAALALILSLSFFLVSCGTDDIDISQYGDRMVTISGAAEEEVTLTIADLKAMDCITRSAESTSDKIGRVKATGPTLETVLSRYGIHQKDLKHIRIYATDGYDVKIGSEVLAEDTVILAFGIDGEPLDSESAPLRIVIPGSDSAYWIRMVERIELTE